MDAMWNIEQSWFNENSAYTRRHPYGEIMPEDEFIGVMKLSDDFDLVWLEEKFNDQVRTKLAAHPNWSESETETETYMRLLEKMMGTLDEKKCTTEIAKNTIIPKDAE